MSPGPVTVVVKGVRQRLRQWQGMAVGLALASVAGAVLVLAWFLAGPGGWTPGTRVPLLLLAGGGLAGAGLAGGLILRLRRWSVEAALTEEVEHSAGLPRGSVRSHVEFSRGLPPGVSPSLARAGEDALASRLTGSPGTLTGRAGREALKHLRVAGGTFLVLLLVAAALLITSPERARTAWAGLGKAAALATPEPLPPLELLPGDARLPRGERPEVRVRAGGRDSVAVHWRGVGEVVRSRTGAVTDGEAGFQLPSLASPVTYWAVAPDGARTREHLLSPVDPTLVTDLVLEVRYPPHTGLPSEIHRGGAPSLVLPGGSEIRVRGGVAGGESVPDEGAVVLREGAGDGGPGRILARFPLREGAFEGAWRPVRSTLAHWGVEEAGAGAAGPVPPPLDVELIPDTSPVVSLPVPGRDMELPLSLRLPLLLEAEDDWGVSWVEVEAVRWSREGEPDPPVVDRIPTGDRPRVLIRPILDVSGWGLEPGDEVRLRARAGDNAPVTGVGETPVYRLRVPDGSRLRELARDRIREAADRTGELARGAARTARELEELEAGRGFEGREELRELLEAREAAARELDELRAGLEEARRALGDEGAEGELRDRLGELERLLSEALAGEDRDRIRDLVERLRDGDASPDLDALEELARDQERFRERLEDALERLRRSAIEAAFEGAEEEARNLAEAQEELFPLLEQSRGAEEQAVLEDRTRELEARMEALLRELTRDGNEEVREGVSEAAGELARAREAMERAGDRARSGDGDDARARGEEAAREAREAADRLEEARREWMADWMEQVREALRRTAQDALSLARRQEEVRERIQGAGALARRDLQGEMAALSLGLRNLGAAAALTTGAVPELGREISVALGEALSEVEATVEGLGGRGGPRAAPYVSAGRALEAMNRVALAALAGLGSVGGGAGGEGGSMEQLLQELEALAARQEALNQEAASLSLEPDSPGAEGRMEDLAAGQQAVAGAVDEVSGRPGAERAMGDLEDLAREARELAEELEGGRLDAETLARQQRILERLLSAGRTLEREGETEEREGTPAEGVERRAVDPLPPELLRPLAFPLPSAGELEALSPGERRLVLEYFERMNRRRAGGGDR